MDGKKRLRGVPEVALRYVTQLPANLPGGTVIGPGVEAAPSALLVSLTSAGRGLAQNGSALAFELSQNADAELVDCLLHQSLRAALIQQRGDIALNGAALTGPNGAATVLCGLAGVGKSVLAYGMTRRGWRLLADGIVRIHIGADGPVVIPSDDTLQLWNDACENLGIDETGLARVRATFPKFLVPVASASASAPLDCIVECIQSSQGLLSALPGTEAGAVLSRNSFRPRHIRAMGLIGKHALAVEKAIAGVPVFRLLGAGHRPPLELADALIGRPH